MRFLGWIVAICIIVLIFSLNPAILDEFRRLKNLTLADLCLVSLLFLSAQMVIGLEMRVLCRPFGISFKNFEWFGLVSIRAYCNYLPFNAGIMANALILKKTQGLPVTKFAALTMFTMVMMFGVAGLIGEGTLIFFYAVGRPFDAYLAVAFGAVFLSAAATLFLPFPNSIGENRFLRWIRSANEGWLTLRTDMQRVLVLFLLRIFLLFLVNARLWVVTRSMGYSMDFGTILLMTCGVLTLKVGTMIPGNLGIREGISGWISQATGVGFEYGFVTMSIDRVIQTVWILVLGFSSTLYFGRNISVKSDE